MAARPPATPLAGIKVLEFSHTVMGPTAGLIFAELGADVVKIEPAPSGDHTRGLGGFGAGFFAAFNRNKRSLSLVMRTRTTSGSISAPYGSPSATSTSGRSATRTITRKNFRPGSEMRWIRSAGDRARE